MNSAVYGLGMYFEVVSHSSNSEKTADTMVDIG